MIPFNDRAPFPALNSNRSQYENPNTPRYHGFFNLLEEQLRLRQEYKEQANEYDSEELQVEDASIIMNTLIVERTLYNLMESTATEN